MTEYDLQNQCTEYLRDAGISYYHLPRAIGKRRNQTTGLPDLLLLMHGGVRFVELKAPGKPIVLREEQVGFLHACAYLGIPANVVNKFEDFVSWVKSEAARG